MGALTPLDHTPPGMGKVGLLFFLAALAALFIAGMVGYVVIRISGQDAPPIGSIHIPGLLWVSTVVILISSVTIQHAVVCAQRERQNHMRISLLATLGLALLFIMVQTPTLADLIDRHRELLAAMENGQGGDGGSAPAGRSLYALIFILILLHALHVIGGLIPLAVVNIKAFLGGYDHEDHRGVSYIAIYWHFLDGVWLVMFMTLLVMS